MLLAEIRQVMIKTLVSILLGEKTLISGFILSLITTEWQEIKKKQQWICNNTP